MVAFNWIVFKATCPSCGEFSKIRAQTHVASDFDGDGHGRFHDRTYRLGSQLRWWPDGDPKFSENDWRVGGRIGAQLEDNKDEEVCYAECQTCRADLFALIRFEGLVAKEVSALGLEENWPDGYYR